MISIEVVAVGKTQEILLTLALPERSTVRDALQASDIVVNLTFSEFFDATDANKMLEIEAIEVIEALADRVGIFGKRVSLEQTLNDGDRIEIYRPLLQDPMELRRKRAKRAIANVLNDHS